MKIVSHRIRWLLEVIQVNVNPPPIYLIIWYIERKTEKYFIKIKLHRNYTSVMSDVYEYKMTLFENWEPEEFLQMIWNYETSIRSPGDTSETGKNQYLSTLLHG